MASKRKIDKESGAARGIDFLHVSNVINFDFPRVTINLFKYLLNCISKSQYAIVLTIT